MDLVLDGMYADVNYEPVTFVSINPAWSNRNLRNLAPKIQDRMFYCSRSCSERGRSLRIKLSSFSIQEFANDA